MLKLFMKVKWNLLFCLNLIFLVSCSTVESVRREREKLVMVQKVSIVRGEAARIDYSVPFDGKLVCDKIETLYHRVKSEIQFFVAASYFSKERVFNCSLEGVKLVEVSVLDKIYPSETLNVDKKRVFLSDDDLKRVIKEREKAKAIYENSSVTPLVRGEFATPLKSKITSYFGTQRLFNNKKKTQHLGIDFRAAVGVPIKTVNSGRVVLAEDLFFSGKTVIVDHGLGVLSFYGHLSKIQVAVGDMVPKSFVIGLAGKTGRVTGPHLHLGLKVHGHWVNGFSIFKR